MNEWGGWLPLTASRCQSAKAVRHSRAYGSHPLSRLARSALIYDPLKLGAVPEPGTWMSLIVGMGLVGMMLRRARAASRLRRSDTAANSPFCRDEGRADVENRVSSPGCSILDCEASFANLLDQPS
ncbi:PEP-CTERM sorting domain-containing protein [Sphingomonas sp. BK345]|uniref:PEP-CTERM sorting domain-containing protein n=1 Tax=Sphingomonas sp. BK345 TaxID=2586980 RepID=UPI001619A524|nr:PEP-CTERM sorting domain-containing protein [Sphingomonas sp. BK345]